MSYVSDAKPNANNTIIVNVWCVAELSEKLALQRFTGSFLPVNAARRVRALMI
jgi:hypothetical protein